MTTSSSVATLQAIRSRLLTWNTNALRTAIGVTASGAGSDGKIYIDQPPENETYPYGVLRVVDRRDDGDDGSFGRQLQVELHLYHRPRSNASLLKDMGDLCERALRAWHDVSSGVVMSREGLSRGSITFEAPADRDLVVERLLLPFQVLETLHSQDTA